jgi:hypothetical protein
MNSAALLVRIIENTAFDRNRTSTPPVNIGRFCMVTTGIDNPRNSTTRTGLLTEVKKTATDVTINPIAKMAKRSNSDKKALSATKKNHQILSFIVMNDRLAPTDLSMYQV